MAMLLSAALLLSTLAQTDTVTDVAAEAGVDPVDLLGAVLTTGTQPRQYLLAVGELAPPPPPVPAVRPVWDRLAACESSGRWAIATGNGYYGGLQMDMAFWRNHGGLAYAARPDLASRVAQILVAEVGLTRQGWGAWPRCSRLLGLR